MVHFGEFLKTWSLRSNSVTRQINFNRTKIGGKCQNSNATFWVIFKHCAADQKSSQNWDSTVAYQKSLVGCWQIVNHEWMSECCWTSSSAFLKVAMWIELMTLVTWRNRITSSWCTLKNDSFGFLNNFLSHEKR